VWCHTVLHLGLMHYHYVGCHMVLHLGLMHHQYVGCVCDPQALSHCVINCTHRFQLGSATTTTHGAPPIHVVCPYNMSTT
jgi:hypothetical protein